MTWDIKFKNIAGIRKGSAAIEEGVNAVRGSNWQGKSSFLTAIQTVMGTEAVLTEGAEQGHVRLETEDNVFEVTLVRENGSIVRRGQPYLENEHRRVSADLYTFLDEQNEVRQAVRNGNNLEEVLTRPLDFENIDERVKELQNEREQVDRELERAAHAASKLPNVEQSITTLENELEELRERRSKLKAGSKNDSDKRDELRSAITEKKDLDNRIDRLERTIERTENNLEETQAKREELEFPDVDTDIDAQISELKSELEDTKQAADLLQSIYAPTKRLLEENKLDLITEVESDLMEDTVTCWTCDHEVSRETIEARLEVLSEQVTEQRTDVDEYERRLERLQEQRTEREQANRRQKELDDRINDLKTTLEDRTASLKQARERRQEVTKRIDELSEEVETEDERLTDIESDIKYKEAELEERYDEREQLEMQTSQQETLQARRDEVAEKINQLRTRKRDLKRRTRDAFEQAMQDVLDRFGTGFESARLTSDFDLVIAREGREARLNALSDGEVELLSIFAALAGYEAFDKTDEVPILLLDDLGGLADENLQRLVEYVEERARFLVFTAYPEHTPIETNTIDPSDWQVVSPKPN